MIAEAALRERGVNVLRCYCLDELCELRIRARSWDQEALRWAAATLEKNYGVDESFVHTGGGRITSGLLLSVRADADWTDFQLTDTVRCERWAESAPVDWDTPSFPP